MKILMTGGSSFTGMWFAKTLANKDHELFVTYTKDSSSDYPDMIRAQRVAHLKPYCQQWFRTSFGDQSFLDLIKKEGPFDVFCHHGAYIKDYRSFDFDVLKATVSNTNNIKAVIEALAGQGCQYCILTGSVFEQNEGAGSEGLPHFSPYGLSKSLSYQIVDYYARKYSLVTAKFVITNPFGPLEDQRFTSYLMRSWLKGEIPNIKTPDYIRDNIHVTLLAKAYANFVENVVKSGCHCKLTPSGYVESQGSFASRFANEMARRMLFECAIKLQKQTEFNEPATRIGVDRLNFDKLDFNEELAWDSIAEYWLKKVETLPNS